ncbi:radical SAM/SPASM protein FxsB, inactivated metallohydrolase extension form [Streptomyces sp. NPDC005485]|uniref:radical SAM/SPASM protein FxsBH, inactivated beta-hydroxylase extension form n=1 Tax=Streptomyces sp. NPDC005485 TaxID=3155591 RepID=UPI0033A741D0
MTHIQELVLKIHSRCNIACDHCYMYEHADQSWRDRPVVISEETVTQIALRLSSYASAHRLDSVSVILHGGEPLLVGPTRLRRICEELTRILAPVTTVDLRMHTNGMLLHRRHLEILREFNVKVGISLDGDQTANDRHRLDRRGRSSYEKVLRGIELLRSPEYRHLFQGLLCTVDVKNDPVTVHDALTALEPPRIDYLLPHSTWDNPPPVGNSDSPTPYADWLLKIFDRWLEQGRPMEVRTFDSVWSTLSGGPPLTEAMGLAPSDLAVVETDGTIEQADSLKTAYDGAPATGYDVFRHTFEEYVRHPGVQARQLGIEGVSETCRRCPVVKSCGGGLYAHRYSTERGFDNPSVFCADLRTFVDGVADRITDRALSPGVHALEELRFAQVELNRTLLAFTNDRFAAHADWSEAWQLLLRLDEDARTAAELNAMLAYPYTRQALRQGLDGPPPTPWLASLLVAVAAGTQTEATLAWEHPDTRLHLPAVGTLRLPRPGRIEVTTGEDGFRVRHAEGTLRVRPGDPDSEHWRSLQGGENGPLIDDADPVRGCFPASVTAPLDLDDRDLFRKLLTRAFELMDDRLTDWRSQPNALAPMTVTPLAKGAGIHLGVHAPGALGVAVDCEPEEILLQLPVLGRRARLAALRDTADLTLAGSPAGQLLDDASEFLGAAALQDRCESPDSEARSIALKRARQALEELAALPERELTETGTVLVGQLGAEWTEMDAQA